MDKKITVAVIGCGSFARNFVHIFKAHPFVEKVYVCDIVREKAEEYRDKFGVEIIDTFEDALSSKEVNAIALFTQRHLHGPMVTAALKAGKHVYSAVPMASEVEHCKEIVELVKETGLTGDEFAVRLLDSKKVAVVPGSAFGEFGKYYVRCSYAYSMKTLALAMEKIAEFVSELKNGNK